MTAVLLVGVFMAGALVGALITIRNAHRLVARLPHAERLSFARKVNRLADRR